MSKRIRVVSFGNNFSRGNREPVPWIWDGVIAYDAITLLSAPEKTGKTTLLSLLLDRLRDPVTAQLAL